ncbi:hypothetical protein [Weissella confusa]|uniref:hypothetical protein n=1 Tax=Weissella confusa TaxID=1583 RepID=UPI00107F13A0|nr:hypothetical protein [Weissella confusa]TGE66731.1 hypothetical protein C6P17_02785 [Weissella confusa]
MTVTVSFNVPQIQPENGPMGIELSQVILPYSIRNSEDFSQYLGGQITLGQSDGIKLTDNTKDWERLGLAKIKNMVAGAEIYVPDPIIEVPEGLPASSATEAPVSSADDSVTSSEATVASSSVEASVSSAEPVSSVAPVSSAESQVTTTPSESTTEE